MTDRNIIQIAASTDNLSNARYLIMTCLRIEDRTVADRILPDDATWLGMGYFVRVTAISDWLCAECFECFKQEDEAA